VFAIGRSNFRSLFLIVFLDRNNCTGVTTTQDPLTKLTKITALENERVVGVACGDVHSLFLTAQNELYTCGANDYYQLGNNGSEHHMQEINLQKHIGDGRITHISSGYYFSCCVVSMFQFFISYTQDKKDLWVWGSNYDSQLGVSGDNKIGITHSKSFNHNSPVKLLQTGSNNIIIVTEDNCLFTCGYNESGQNANNDRTNVKVSFNLFVNNLVFHSDKITWNN
jgi:alpha-tubulin suppressor-like RCC1 family protein